MADDLSEILGVTDIRQAREAQIFPLPSRAIDADGNVVVTQYEPGAGPTFAPYVAAPATLERPRRADAVPARVGQWKNALLDLSLRNKLINYTDRAGYRIEVPGPCAWQVRRRRQRRSSHQPAGFRRDQIGRRRYEASGSGATSLSASVNSCWPTSAVPTSTSPRPHTRRKLRYLAYKAKTIVEETGANNLYLAFGMLSWRFSDRELRSPLVLVPVSLATANRGERYVLTIDEAGASTPNYCLVEKLRVAFGLEIPGLPNPTEDASGIDLGRNVQRGPSRRSPKPVCASASKRPSTCRSCSSRSSRCGRTSTNRGKSCPATAWSHTSSRSPTERFTDPVAEAPAVDLDELGTSVPVPADSSQLNAVAEAVAGRTFVLEGPPGTGKSQTITNLLAHAMASGRRVLFVAEKRAALDVVKKRLEAVGSGELSLDLHDKSARPAAVRAADQGGAGTARQPRPGRSRDQFAGRRIESRQPRPLRRSACMRSTPPASLALHGAFFRTGRRPGRRSTRGPCRPRRERDRRDLRRDRAGASGLAREGRPRPAQRAAIRGASSTFRRPDALNAGEIHSAAVEFDQALGDLQSLGLDVERIARAESAAALSVWARACERATISARRPFDAIAQRGMDGRIRDDRARL